MPELVRHRVFKTCLCAFLPIRREIDRTGSYVNAVAIGVAAIELRRTVLSVCIANVDTGTCFQWAANSSIIALDVSRDPDARQECRPPLHRNESSGFEPIPI
jgi:hypothetical protein